MSAVDLTERVRLLQRRRCQNESGDWIDAWQLVVHTWAQIILKSQSLSVEETEKLAYLVKMRSHNHDFVHIEWRNKMYKRVSGIHRDRWTEEMSFFMTTL